MTEVRIQSGGGSTMAFSAFLFIILTLNCCRAQVPLIMWTSEGSTLPPMPHPAAGETVSGGQFVSYLRPALKTAPRKVLLFLQDELSMDDFTMYAGVFGDKQDSVFPNLEAALESSSSPLVLPSVAVSVVAMVPTMFQEELGIEPVLTDPDTLSQWQPLAEDSSLLLFRLAYTPGGQAKELLRQNDETIARVLKAFQAHGLSYTAVYTGLKPSREVQDMTASWSGDSTGRSLLQTPPTPGVKPPVMFNDTGSSPCILLWAEILNVSYEGSEWIDLAPGAFEGTVSLNGSMCNGTLSRLVLNYANILNFQTLRLIFSMRKVFFPVSARNWTLLEQVELEYDGQTAVFNGSRGIYAPAEYSFHCQSVSSFRDPLLVPRNAQDNAILWRIAFTDFQIQGFNVTGENFSYASDCAGFFTPGIWMGLVTSLLMLLVLTYGLHMITQLRTMDRFDDPKGPAIAVPLND